MFDFDPFDMGFDGDVDGIDFFGLDDLMRQGVHLDESEGECAQGEMEEHN